MVAVVVFVRVTRRVDGWLAFGAWSRGPSDRGTPVSSCAVASPRSIGASRHNDMRQNLFAPLRGKIVGPPKKSRHISWGDPATLVQRCDAQLVSQPAFLRSREVLKPRSIARNDNIAFPLIGTRLRCP